MCGIIGIYHKKEHACGDVYDALIQVQHRGQDAAGISTLDTDKISSHKEIGLVTEVFKYQDTFEKSRTFTYIDHEVPCQKFLLDGPSKGCKSPTKVFGLT